ncbi:MAG: peptidase C14 [Leptolyngbya sp. SIOISBB]|nr:peptidase C14 [Leptolyngbya sp. SIOISBB]
MTRVALVVGINTYTHFPDLKAPAQDAEAIAQRLQQDGDFKVHRFPEALVREGEQLSPTVGETLSMPQAQLEAELKQLFRPDSAQIPDAALFYFSGHGLPDPEGADGLDKGYLVASDTDPRQTRPGVSLAWLQNLLAHSPIANQIVWLDCCHSGGLLINVQAANPGHRHDRSRCFIASSRDFEKSWQDLNSPYSVLTKALLDGLDPTRLPGRWVDTFALVDSVNQALKGELQTPTCTNFGDAINLTRTWQVADETTSAAATDSGLCPYKGLEFFDLNDTDPQYFFGREALTNQLIDQVRTSNFMALVGASGNGKSSVLRAGLLHQLRVGRRIAGSDQWQLLMMRPDAQPMKNLATAFLPMDGSQLDRAEALGRAEGILQEGGTGLARLIEAAPAPRVLLVVDQFEEVFTRCDDLDEREQFFACLMGALQIAGDKLCQIIAMRSDFVGKCLERDYSGLAQQVQQYMVSVLPMQPDELRAAICQPAIQVGLTVEDTLVTETLNDIKGAPGSLPLLQYTLKELWQRRQGNQLVLSAYQALGGINGTLDQRATELYQGFNAEQQRTVRHLFQQLTQLGEGTEDTRRRVFLDNLVSEPLHSADRVQTVVEKLADKENRLLVTSEVVGKDDIGERRAIVDVAHEALIRHWRLLRQWIEQNRDLLRQQRRTEASAVNWQEYQKGERYLLEGWALKEAVRFMQQQADTFPLSDSAKVFIKQSQWKRRWVWLKTASWLIIPAVIVVGVVENHLREQRVRADFERIDDLNQRGVAEKFSAEDLVRGCRRGVPLRSTPALEPSFLGNYIGERLLFGNCRSLSRLDFISADLRDANLRDSELVATDFISADLRYANFRGANLISANLREANLISANLRDTNLRYADFRDANLRYANLTSADLRDTDLSDANLNNAIFTSADFRDANLSDAVLINADLRNADPRNADLRNADFRSAILLATDLRGTNLTPQQLTGEGGPYLCDSALPDTVDIEDTDLNRDCDAIRERLIERYSLAPEHAREIVNDARQKIWAE